MKEHPILFSGPMVRAICEGRKTQTRRLIKFPADWDGDIVFQNDPFGVKYSDRDNLVHRLYPKWQAGDSLWVRETWRPRSHSFPIGAPYEYRATDEAFVPDDLPWKPSIFMPRAASRITLEVTSVRAERLNDLGEYDAIQEGVDPLFSKEEMKDPSVSVHYPNTAMPWKNYGWPQNGGFPFCNTARISFRTLWDTLYGPFSWNENPWVWVILFRPKILRGST